MERTSRKKTKSFAFILGLIFLPVVACATTNNIPTVHKMMILVFQLAVIIFTAKYTGKFFERIKLPAVIGELFAGIIIGPYLLGGISLPGLPHGLFGEFLFNNPGSALPVSPELYGFSVVASILLLFIVGLETDINLFLRFSVPSLVIGGFGVLFSFAVGAGVAMLFLDVPFIDPQVLFLGVISTATSVGITARILSSHNKINSPEGVTILGSAVIDDVLGIILLAIVVGLIGSGNSNLNWGSVGKITLKALIVWIGFTALGLIFAKHISRFLKTFENVASVGIMAFGIALVLAGIFESAGLAMIIGAYVTGLTLSKTDLTYVIQDSLHNLYDFLVPIFFCVSGMFVNFRVFSSWEVVTFGLIYTVTAYLAKTAGCGIPSFLFKFNRIGAGRIGVGMVPRGEVALIIIGLGLSYGILDDKLSGVAILMIFITTALAPVQLNSMLKKKGIGTKKHIIMTETKETIYTLPSQEVGELVLGRLIKYFRDEGFFINLIEGEHGVYHVRRNDTFLSFRFEKSVITFSTTPDDVAYVKNIMYELLLDLNQIIEKLKTMAKPEDIKKGLTAEKGKSRISFSKVLKPENIIMNLTPRNKERIIESLVDILDKNNLLHNKKETLNAILEREKTMSTGMQNGIALPHGKTDGVKKMAMAVGLKPEGADFGSLDGKPSTVFILVISPKNTAEPHIQLLSEIGKKLFSIEQIDKLLACKTRDDVYHFFTQETR